MSIAIIFISFFLRGFINFLNLFFNIKAAFRLDWLDNQSISMAIMAGMYFIIVDILPCIYLSFGIWVVTTEYSESKKVDNALWETDRTIFTTLGEESNIIDKKGWGEDSIETSFFENEVENRSIN